MDSLFIFKKNFLTLSQVFFFLKKPKLIFSPNIYQKIFVVFQKFQWVYFFILKYKEILPTKIHVLSRNKHLKLHIKAENIFLNFETKIIGQTLMLSFYMIMFTISTKNFTWNFDLNRDGNWRLPPSFPSTLVESIFLFRRSNIEKAWRGKDDWNNQHSDVGEFRRRSDWVVAIRQNLFHKTNKNIIEKFRFGLRVLD